PRARRRSGNVSLYNETLGQAIPPTPTIAGVGLIPDWSKMARIAFAGESQAILLAGAPEGWGTHLGQSVYLRDIYGRAEGNPPPVDLAHEKRVGDFLRNLIRSGKAAAVHDCSDGGLAVALAEMAMASGIGATIEEPDNDPAAAFFGEDQGRYVLTVAHSPEDAAIEALVEDARKAGVSLACIGATGGHELKLGNTRAISVSELRAAHEGWFPRFMEG
ncbi:AIR synthase-related protein, partial [Chelativorans sp.]|uniref:AIR synthase-related protein n=1 Tax=Chelativorans sp. TaxID=2203393 RepID=UPI002811F195